MKSVKYYWREITEYDKVFKYLTNILWENYKLI